MGKTGSFFVAFWMRCVMLAPLSAQPEDIISRFCSMKDGLSHETPLCLLQDSQGFLWIGTGSGLNKFDGYHFTNYLENPSDSNGLANNWITCLWEDKQQRLWIGTSTGLELLDLKMEKFHRLLPDSLDSSYLADIGVQDGIHIKKIRGRKDGKVWICTWEGVYLAELQTLSITRHIYFPEQVDKNAFQDIAESQNGTLWVANQEGFIQMNVNTGQTTWYRHDPKDPHSLVHNTVTAVHIDRNDRVWVGTAHGLDLFKPEDQSFTHFLPVQIDSDKTISQQFNVHDLLDQKDGTFLIAFLNGLYVFNAETGKFDLLVHEPSSSIFQDSQGSTWLGTRGGLFQIAPLSKNLLFTISLGKPTWLFPLLKIINIMCGSSVTTRIVNFLGLILLSIVSLSISTIH